MQPFNKLTSAAILFYRENIDTDVIIPARHLKTISRLGLGKWCFETLRYDESGQVRNSSPFDHGASQTANILITGANFGCGSSREHAVWALMDMGVRCIIGPSFADIFSSNALKNGMLLITLPQEVVQKLAAEVKSGTAVSVNLADQWITTPSAQISFDIDDFRKTSLLNGTDEIGLTLRDEDKITAFEQRDKLQRPWLWQENI
ncbi:MAG: 3-isopropylmalate dehydratase small subunit [Parvularculaceae bacterium]